MFLKEMQTFYLLCQKAALFTYMYLFFIFLTIRTLSCFRGDTRETQKVLGKKSSARSLVGFRWPHSQRQRAHGLLNMGYSKVGSDLIIKGGAMLSCGDHKVRSLHVRRCGPIVGCLLFNLDMLPLDHIMHTDVSDFYVDEIYLYLEQINSWRLSSFLS